MRQLAARVRRVHLVLSRVARLRVADIDSDVVAAFSAAVNKLTDNIHILSAKIVPGTTQAQVTVKPESYTLLGIDPRAKPEGHVFVSLEEGPLENGILELDVSCGRSHVLVDVKKGKPPRVVKRTPQVTRNFDALAMGLAQSVADAYTRHMTAATVSPTVEAWDNVLLLNSEGLDFSDSDDRAIFRTIVSKKLQHAKLSVVKQWLAARAPGMKMPNDRNKAVRMMADVYMMSR